MSAHAISCRIDPSELRGNPKKFFRNGDVVVEGHSTVVCTGDDQIPRSYPAVLILTADPGGIAVDTEEKIKIGTNNFQVMNICEVSKDHTLAAYTDNGSPDGNTLLWVLQSGDSLFTLSTTHPRLRPAFDRAILTVHIEACIAN